MTRSPLQRRAAVILAVAGLLLFVGVRWCRSQTGTASAANPAPEQALSPEEKARLKKLDDGPKTIDITAYPADQKAAYPLFTKKCSKCHSIGRPINSDFVLPSQWERYVKRMTYKPNSKISQTDGKTIYHFLVYDSSVRKVKSLRGRLAGLTAEERAVEIDKVKAINPAFKTE